MRPTARPRRRGRRSGSPLPGLAAAATDRRHALALTQVELAELAGVGRSTVKAVEAGEASLTLAVTLRVLDALGLTLAVGPRPQLAAVPGVALLDLPEPEPPGPAPAGD